MIKGDLKVISLKQRKSNLTQIYRSLKEQGFNTKAPSSWYDYSREEPDEPMKTPVTGVSLNFLYNKFKIYTKIYAHIHICM